MLKYIIIALSAAAIYTIVYTIAMWVYKDQLHVAKRINALISNNRTEAVNNQLTRQRKERNIDTKLKILKRLANELSLSGMMIRPSEFLVIWMVATLVPSSLCLVFTGEVMIALAILLIGLVLPPFFMHYKKVKRVELFEQQLVDAIAIICNCLRAGLTFQQAMVSISNEMPEPISKEFGRVVRELRLGNNIEKALTNMSDRLNSKNFMFIVSAVLIQRQIGGNLSDILSNIAGTIHERHKIKSEIKVLTTTGRTSGMVVGFMPIVLLLIFMIINPDYVKSFFDSTLGIAMLVTAAVLEVAGFLIIRKIVNIKF